MLTLNGRNIFLGGVHDHWSRADGENPSLLLAALNFYHYDFVFLMDAAESDLVIQRAAAAYSGRLKVYLGREDPFGWGHMVTITPRAGQLPQDEPDWRLTLRKLKPTCDLILLAHPAYPTTWQQIFCAGKLDELLDEGLIDGLELTIDLSGVNNDRNAELIRWFEKRDKAGKLTPIIGGWDVHMAVPVAKLPPVLYSADRAPDGTFEAPCNNRTILFAERNTLEDLCGAIRTGQTVVEDLRTGKLVGPAKLVQFLQDNGYREAVKKMDTARDAVRLSTSGEWVGGKPANLKVSQPGHLRWPVSFTENAELPLTGDHPATPPVVPLLLERDQSYLPVAWRDGSGAERIWAVQTAHPVQFDILPSMGKDGIGLEFVPSSSFRGSLRVELEQGYNPIEQKVEGRTIIPLQPVKGVPLAVPYQAAVELPTGVRRTRKGFLSYIPVRRFQGDWEKIPRMGVDKTEFAPRFAFGSSRPWPGADVYSAQLQFAWDEQAFYFRADVTDEIHYQPFGGHYAYNGDCLQLAIDPLLRRRESIGSLYSYNLALTDQGPELFRLLGPSAEASESFTPLPRDESLGDRFLSITPIAGGLRYDMRLPWSQLAPVVPAVGTRMGVYYIMFNNNGQGHLDTMHWPVPIRGMWTVPSKWGVLSFVE